MTLKEMSGDYEAAAMPLRKRIAELRKALKTETDPEAVFQLKRRIAELTPMLTQCNELAELTARYHERGFYRAEKYTVTGIPRIKSPGGSPGSQAPQCDSERTYSFAAGDDYQLLLQGVDDGADCE